MLCVLVLIREGVCKRQRKIQNSVLHFCVVFHSFFSCFSFFYECRRGIKKRAYEKQQKAAHTAAVIASIESLPEDLRENAWRSIAWHNFHSKLTYNEWCCQMFDEYDLPDEIFDSSFYPRSEIQRLRDELKREAPHA